MAYLHKYQISKMRNIVAGNWKSNKSIGEAREWITVMGEAMDSMPHDVRVMIAPPAPFLSELAGSSRHGILIAAQQVSAFSEGAYTGEFTASMLVSCGVDFALVGHSERRESFGESDEMVAKKVRRCIDAGLGVVLCCGENLAERDNGSQESVIKSQLITALEGVSSEEMEGVVVAYEPIWAIGTGRTASAEQAAEMHRFIRNWISEDFDAETASKTSILYGGSCKSSNANEIFASADVDGGLIGGASLKTSEFQLIIKADSSL